MTKSVLAKLIQPVLIVALILSAAVINAKDPDRRDCPANDLYSGRTDPETDSVVPPAIISAVQPALATLIALTRDIKSDSADVLKMALGSAFVVNVSHERTTWLSAFHVTGGIIHGEKLLLFLPHESFLSFDSDGVMATLAFDTLLRHPTEVDSRWYSYDRENTAPGKGFDFSEFDDRGVSFTPERRSTTGPLDLRDLEKNPLLLNETVYLLGMQFGMLRAIVCSNEGYDRAAFAKNFSITAVMRCPLVTLDGNGGVPLGGISGGAFVDSQARVVGIFNGASFQRNSAKTLRLLATPVFKHSDLTLHPYPALENLKGRNIRCLPCYPHDSKSARYLLDPEKDKSMCAITDDQARRQFHFYTR